MLILKAVCDDNIQFSAAEWNAYAKDTQENFITIPLNLLSRGEVNWCPGLGTV
jgi:hypothetical protein